jgi:hypothetical protein
VHHDKWRTGKPGYLMRSGAKAQDHNMNAVTTLENFAGQALPLCPTQQFGSSCTACSTSASSQVEDVP